MFLRCCPGSADGNQMTPRFPPNASMMPLKCFASASHANPDPGAEADPDTDVKKYPNTDPAAEAVPREPQGAPRGAKRLPGKPKNPQKCPRNAEKSPPGLSVQTRAYVEK